MYRCTRCGIEVEQECFTCPKCHGKMEEVKPESINASLREIAFYFCFVCTILCGLAIIPLLWMIPLTIGVYKANRDHMPLTTGYCVVILIFVSRVAGILLLVDSVNIQK